MVQLMSPQETSLVQGNRLPYRCNPAHYIASFTPGKRRLTELSRGDLLQVLCSAVEAMEQFVLTGFDDLTDTWRVGRSAVVNPADYLPPASPVQVWAAPAAPGSDDDGIANTLPTVYNIDGWQWEEKREVIMFRTMNKHDLMQAVAITMDHLNLIDKRVQRLQRVIGDWQQGTLVPDADTV